MSESPICRIYRLKYAVSTEDVRVVELYGVTCEELGQFATFITHAADGKHSEFEWQQHENEKAALQAEKDFVAELGANDKYVIRKTTGPLFSGNVFNVLKQNTDMTTALLRSVLKDVSPTKSADMLDWIENTVTERDDMWASW